jgi:hypothetical protein
LFVVDNKRGSEVMGYEGVTGVQGVHTEDQDGDDNQEAGLNGEVAEERQECCVALKCRQDHQREPRDGYGNCRPCEHGYSGVAKEVE